MIKTLQKVVHSQYGGALISVVLGLGLACLFRKACKGSDCIRFKSPSVKDLDGQVYRHGATCHAFTAVTKNCELDKEKRVTFQ